MFEPPEVHTHGLLPTAIAGLIVNLIGIFAFQHAHTHGGQPCQHGHSHSKADNRRHHSHGGNATLVPRQSDSAHVSVSFEFDPNPATTTPQPLMNHSHSSRQTNRAAFDSHVYSNDLNHNHNHGHSHDHDHKSSSGRNFVMDGVLLHVMADTLGSVGVIVSSLLIHKYNWMIADPICSIFMSVLILLSVGPLLRQSMAILMERTPAELEGKLYECFDKVTKVRGVISFREPHFWSLSPSLSSGSLAVLIRPDADDTFVRESVSTIFRSAGIDYIVVQVERF